MTVDERHQPSLLDKLTFVFPETLRILLSPALRRLARDRQEQMRRDGVDPADARGRQAWVRAHREELTPLRGVAASPIVRAEPKRGRNAPCPCGSGKKYKRCCFFKPT